MFLATGGAASEAARRVADNGEFRQNGDTKQVSDKGEFWQNGTLLKKGGQKGVSVKGNF